MQTFSDRLGHDPLRAILSGAAERHGTWAVGSVGELLVAQLLDQLPIGWHITHDVALGRKGNIDHVLVGPSGVFTLNTKFHGSKTVLVADRDVEVAGRVVQHVPKAEREVSLARTALCGHLDDPTQVLGLVVVVCDEYFVLRAQTSASARLVHVDRLLHVLTSKKPVLSTCSIRRLTRAVRNPDTWRSC